MSRESLLKKAIEAAISSWSTRLDIDLELDDTGQGIEFYSVVLTYEDTGAMYEFEAQVQDSGECYMDYSESDWHLIDQESLFTWMWFEEAHRKSA